MLPPEEEPTVAEVVKLLDRKVSAGEAILIRHLRQTKTAQEVASALRVSHTARMYRIGMFAEQDGS